jgi:hypothetical protein
MPALLQPEHYSLYVPTVGQSSVLDEKTECLMGQHCSIRLLQVKFIYAPVQTSDIPVLIVCFKFIKFY